MDCTSLWSSSDAWETAEYAAEAIVIIGCLFEGLADFEVILKGNNNERKRKRVAKLAFLALILGLSFGLSALVRTNQLFTETITRLYGEARDANDRAKAASDKAGKAQDRADKASAHEEELETRTKREIDARLELEKQFIWEGPRSLAIEDNRAKFKRQLIHFSGQRFRTSLCWPDIPPSNSMLFNSEVALTHNAIVDVLIDSGWKPVEMPQIIRNGLQLPFRHPPVILENCSSLYVQASILPDAPVRVRRAATAVLSVLTEVLENPPLTVGLIRPGLPLIADPADRLASDVIELHIGEHPAYRVNLPKQTRGSKK